MLSSFWLNAEQEVRLNLCCTLLVCHVLFLQDIGHITNGDNVPVIGMFLLPLAGLCLFNDALSNSIYIASTASVRPVDVPAEIPNGPSRIQMLPLNPTCSVNLRGGGVPYKIEFVFSIYIKAKRAGWLTFDLCVCVARRRWAVAMQQGRFLFGQF
jgi:hypothetical protein